MLISIIVPCYNEEGNVEILYNRLSELLSVYRVEFIFIDDNSTDNTLLNLEKLSSNDNVKYLSFSRNFGHQSALRAGLKYSIGDCVISMDADLQHPPEIVEDLIMKWNEGYDVVYTIRRDIANISLFKKLTSSFFYKVINSLSDIEVRPGSADFRLLDRKVVEVLINDITEYHLFYRGLISWIGFNQYGIEYVPNKRFSGVSKYSFLKMLNFAVDGITSFSIKPLKFAILLGLLLSGFSSIYAVYAIIIYFFSDEAVKGWTSLILCFLFVGGVNMILLGIMGEYLGKLYIESKKRPYYIVKKSNFNYE